MKRLIFVLILGVVVQVQAGIVEIHTDTIINSGYYGDVAVCDSAKLDMFGGSISTLYGRDNSQTFIHNCLMISALDIRSSSIVEVYDGQIMLRNLRLADSGTLNIFGGNWYLSSMLLLDNSSMNIHGYGFNFNIPFGILTGFLADSSPFEFSGEGLHYGWSHVHLFETPEPATVLLLGLGALFLIRKRK